MSHINKEAVLDEVTESYLSSPDFNGVPLWNLMSLKIDLDELVQYIEELILEERVCALFPDTDINTHIMRLGYEPVGIQIEKLKREELDAFHTCLYPLRKHLEQVIDRATYMSTPYILELALGSPQLSYKAFDLSVLEFYRNDPRYHYTNDEIRGYISISSQFYESPAMPDSDQILLNSFGFCYEDSGNRAVAVYLRDLARLSAEHQQIWRAKELTGHYKLHPDYYANTIVGDWSNGVSIFEAFLEELRVINKMSEAMRRPPLFRGEFSRGERPREFSFLVRPTLKEFNEFVLLLDKLISDNINLAFFQNEIPYEEEVVRKDGKIIVTNKGTLRILNEWLDKYYRAFDREPINEMMGTFREIRKMWQKPAHAINENIFDQQYIRDQRALMKRAYESIRVLRLIFSDHPAVEEDEIDTFVTDESLTIWTM